MINEPEYIEPKTHCLVGLEYIPVANEIPPIIKFEGVDVYVLRHMTEGAVACLTLAEVRLLLTQPEGEEDGL
jgi:hypothetical protein